MKKQIICTLSLEGVSAISFLKQQYLREYLSRNLDLEGKGEAREGRRNGGLL